MKPAAWLIAGRETRSVVGSPGGLVVLGTFWLVAGILFVSLIFRFRDGWLQVAQTGGLRTETVGLHVNDWVVRPLLYNLGTVLILFVPLLTMRSFAEERRSGNLELLMSQPLQGADLVLGKFFGATGALFAGLAVLLGHLAILGLVSRPDWPAAFVGLLGLGLLGSFFVAVGILLSVLSRSPIEAAVLSLGALLLVVVAPGGGGGGPGWLASAREFFAVLPRFEDFTRGLLDLGHVFFFVGAIFVLLAAALRGLDLVRWQG